MENYKHYLEHINDSIIASWDSPAFRDYQTGISYTYAKAAEMITKLGIIYEDLGLKRGTKIAVCGNNCSNIAISILSTLCNGMVAVMILPDFTGDDIVKLVNHSDAELLIASSNILRKIKTDQFKNVRAVIDATNFRPSYLAKEKYIEAFNTMESHFAARYPMGLKKENCAFTPNGMNELAVINYTSGTTSAPKGVMISNRALSSNIQYDIENMECHAGITLVSMLPLAHMFGFTIELVYNFCGGAEVCFVTRLTTLTLMSAFRDCKPIIILTVPLVIEKIYERKIKPIKNSVMVKLLWNAPIIGSIIKRKIKNGLMQAFGGNLNTLIIGGASLLPEVEQCLVDIKFPYVIGYGMTECAPLVSYVEWRRFVPGSCGKAIDRVQIRIDSEDENNVVGEILLKGDNLMMGYYKNAEATTNAFTEDGWLRSGDLGIKDKDGNLFLKGRCKSMILSSSGQNIYPEEIEKLLNAEPEICESLVVQRDKKLVALIYPDQREGITRENIEQAVNRVNERLPSYSRIASLTIRDHEFQKTPKLSIKRHLY